MEIIDRLQYLMKLHNLSASAFADKINVQRSSISHILSGRNKPSLELMQKVLAAFPKVNADWLILGNTSAEQVSIEVKKENPVVNTPQPEKTFSTPTPTTHSGKQVKKVVIFYTDNTFEEIIKTENL
jgi:transcriptional regulator with XRE-family HTH domain